MKIKRLTLQGYKTFASKTEFIFDEGITAIVGPNGSGKSNIADALRWVLGEQSYSTLRGKRTTDMIFAGSQRRARAGMAHVVVTLDNAGGWLPIDYTEVEIGRRAYRTGENEYTLNGQRVRLKDVTELLATSGLAERTYTVIGQGLIDRALSLKSDERRALFEEAAGINHYKNRRAETLRRLKDTQHNLERVHDILNEIRPRLTSLKRQATRAQNYEQILADLRHLLKIWYGHRWEQAKKGLRQSKQQAEQAEEAWKTERRKVRVQQENIDDLRRRINQRESRLAEVRAEQDSLRTELEKARREVAILQERQTAVTQQLHDITADLPTQEAQRKVAQSELEMATGELQTAQAELNKAQTAWQQFNETFAEQAKAIKHWQAEIKRLEQTLRQGQTRLAQAEGQVAQLQERRADWLSGDDGQDELQAVLKELEKLTAVHTTYTDKVKTHREKRDTLSKERQTLIQELKRLRREVRDDERTLNKQRNQLARLEERARMLDQLRQKEQKLGKGVEVIGQFASYLTIPPKHQKAIEGALQERLGTLLLKDEGMLWQALLSDVTAVSLPHVTPHTYDPITAEGVIGWAHTIITCQPEGQMVADLLLGNVLLVADEQVAFDLAPQLPAGTRAVAPSGLVVEAGGLMDGNGRSAQSSIIARENEWREATQAVAQMQETLQVQETAISQKQKTIQTQQTQVDEIQRDETRFNNLSAEANGQASKVQRDMDRLKQQQSYLQRQQQNRQKELEQLHDRIMELIEAIQKQEGHVQETATSLQEAQDALAALPVAEADQQRAGLRQAIDAQKTIVAGRKAVVDSRRTTLHEVEKQLTRLQGRQASLQTQAQQLQASLANEGHKALEEKLERVEMAINPLQTSLKELRTEVMKADEETAVLQRHTHDLETQYTQTRVQLTQQQNQIDALQERIKADIGLVELTYDDDQTGATPLPISEVVQQLPTVDELPENIEETIQTYRGQLQRMGAINPDAPTEYEEAQERFDFLTQQVEDLTQTDAQLREIIDELDELTSRAFKETVEKVNVVFGDTFTQLFGGGSAQLVLTDPDDLTVSGVDIIARLPNRREQGLGLLSGGERSLTAAGLIFSLLKVSPTPFCVMDEVDAALDEANITRFRDQLRELGLITQFIVITHNRGTVQAAQTIYGISMGTDSASQMISIKPEEYLKQAELL